MKIAIMTDLEGVAGVVCDRQLSDISNPFYRQARAGLMGEVNAAVAGAREAGATEIVILDGHGSGFDMALDLGLIHDHDVNFLLGTGGDFLEVLDNSFNAFFMIGQHPRKAPVGCLEHSWGDRVFMRTTLCGIEVGEIGFYAAVLGERGIPLALVSGDEEAAREMDGLAANVVGVAVKRGYGRSHALTRHPEKACAMIRQAAVQALKNLAHISCWRLKPPFVFDIEYTSAVFAAKCERLDFITRTGDNTLRVQGETLAEVCRRFNFLNHIVY